MSQALITESLLTDIADAIRAKLGANIPLRPGDMPSAIRHIGGDPALQTLVAFENRTYTPDIGYDGFSSVTVNVQPNLQSKTATQNGTVTADQGYDGLSSVDVNVTGGGGDTRTPIAAWDFKGASPLIDNIGGKVLTNNGVTFDADGAYFAVDSSLGNSYGLTRGKRLFISITDLLGTGSLAGCDVEVDVGNWDKWALKSSDAGRMLMLNANNGMGYRQTGSRSNSGWNIYDNAWTNANIISTLIDYSTVKLSFASSASDYDKIYVNGNLVITDNTTGNRLADAAEFLMLGGPDNTATTGVVETSVGACHFSALRVYRR